MQQRRMAQRRARAHLPGRRCRAPQFEGLRFPPHDLRRLFATELVNNGLPIHLGAALLGHTNLQTTRGYVAVFNEDVVRHYQQYLERRRAQRNSEEYRPPRPRNGAGSKNISIDERSNLGPAGGPTARLCT